jgi:hypothetical protein
MNPSARVFAVDALREFHAALARFGAKARESLAEGEMEVRHAFDWLEERLQYWTHEVQVREEAVTRCRTDLALARAVPTNWRTATTEPEIALARAKARLREAEDKVAVVRRWRRELPQAVTEYELPARRLAGFLDGDLLQALALLAAKADALRAYLELTPAARPPAPPAGESP